MTYIIAGASSGLGRALAERFAAAGEELILLSRNVRDTQPLAQHLAVRYEVKATPLTMDLGKDVDLVELDGVLGQHAPLSGLLLPAGVNDEADQIGVAEDVLDFVLQTNFISLCKIVNHYLPTIEANSGHIVGFGSVASARGRSKNAVYAAAKSALQSYFESLDHYAADKTLHTQFYVLGYLDTNLAFSQSLLFPLADPNRVADLVFARLNKSGSRFVPRFWYIVYRIVQLLPGAIFKRLSF